MARPLFGAWRALPIMGSFDLLLAVAVAITRGAILMSPAWSVGPYLDVSTAPGESRFACLDLQGVPSRAFETWDEAYLLRGEVRHEEQYGTDWSAFGAARMFLACAGPKAVEEALARLDEGMRETRPGVAPCS